MTRGQRSYCGRILRVDLNDEKISTEYFDLHALRNFVGGAGLGTKIIYDEVPPSVGPFDPENRLVLAAGPLAGTRSPGAGTYSCATKGPLTNLFTSTQGNGFFGARMRSAGYDAIVIQGVSPSWVYLSIHDGEAALRPAQHLLGLDTFDTEDRLKSELGQPRSSVCCIGPSGEHLVKFAALHNDRGHFCASNGPGAVMGSKRLKAIIVEGSTQTLDVWDPERLKELWNPWLQSAERGPLGHVKYRGTIGGYLGSMAKGIAPVKNMTTNVFPEAPNFLIRERFELRKRPCFSCPWAHCHQVKVTDGPYTGFETMEPEVEGLSSWGAMVGITDAGTMLKIHDLNDRLGMDTKEGAWVVSMAFECYEKGIIGPQDTDGLELRWGNADAVMSLLRAIADRRGFGGVLAEGTKRAAELIGGDALNCAVYAKQGISPHTVDIRASWALLVAHLVSDMSSYSAVPVDLFPSAELGYPEGVPPFSAKELPAALAKGTPRKQFDDTLGCCQFLLSADLQILTDALSAVTGWDFTFEEAMEVGERLATLQRAYSIRHGVTPEKDDTMSVRLASAPVEGIARGKTVAPFLPEIRREYYRLMGWDEVTSQPLPHTLRRLGLESLIEAY